MSDENKAVLKAANEAIRKGDIEGFLAFCAEDIEWTTVGKETLEGKSAVREWMKTAYAKPPEFTVTDLMAEDDLVAAIGEIATGDEHDPLIHSPYCDVWRFRDGKMVELRAFVIAG